MIRIVVLDSLFDSLDVEEQTARRYQASIERWDGSAESLATADVVAHVRTRIDAELIAGLRACQVITRFGTGVDTVDLAAASAANIAVVTVRDYCLPELCSHTLALAFNLTRRIQETHTDPDANWQQIAQQLPLERAETATVIGMGSVGTRVAAALKALGLRVTAVTRTKGRADELGIAAAPLQESLPDADLVFLHAALDPGAAPLIDEQALRLVKPPAILINTARLGLIDERAVADSLERNRLGGLGIDAHLSPGSPLRRLINDPRLLVTPHLGWYSRRSANELRQRAIADALARVQPLSAEAEAQ